jgi:hypothetical protein
VFAHLVAPLVTDAKVGVGVVTDWAAFAGHLFFLQARERLAQTGAAGGPTVDTLALDAAILLLPHGAVAVDPVVVLTMVGPDALEGLATLTRR